MGAAEFVLVGGPVEGPPARPSARRGTTNGNQRGSAEARRRRREWLVTTYRADVDVSLIAGLVIGVVTGTEGAQPACRCYRCGHLLTVDTLTVDRIKPGCQGGTYARSNIRPACSRCNSETGGRVRGR